MPAARRPARSFEQGSQNLQLFFSNVASAKDTPMSNDNTLSRAELDDRIAILQDNIRQLIEQAAAVSGGQTEERAAERIAQQSEELERLMRQRDALPAK
jgi:uncharacterized small protein (DUF1192 family)